MVLAAAMTGCLAVAASPPALADDTRPWTGDSAIGAHQPYQHGYSAVDLLRWDPAADADADLLRARVPLQERIAPDARTQRHPALPADTQLHTLAGDYGNAFFESHHDTNEFSQHLFGYWQYTDYYGSWHGQPTAGIPAAWYDPDLEWTQRWFEFGMLNLPNPAYTNAAHRNGVQSLATIFFSDDDRGEQTFTDLLVRAEDGTFPVATKLAEVARYFGFDGYFVNQEEVSVHMTAEQITAYQELMQQLRADGLYVQWYDSVTSTGQIDYQNEFNALNSPYVLDDTLGRVSDSIFLNYWWDAAKLTASRDHADSLGLDPRETLFVGVEAGLYRFDQPYDLTHNLGADGTPMNAIAILGADFVHADHPDKTDDDAQWGVFDRERRWWTGSSTGGTTPDGDWQGVAHHIAERSVIGGTTFATTFNTGHGLEYRTAGAVTSTSEWGNINVQDVPVTWQWWLDAADSPLAVDYDYGPDYTAAPRFDRTPVGAYAGGSSLVLAGDVTSDNVLRLYQTDLAIKAGTGVEVTWNKTSATDDTAIAVAAVLASDPSTVVELPLTASGEATDGWRTGTVDLSGHAGDRLVTLGLVVRAGVAPVADYQVNIGALRVTDGVDRTPAAPTGLTVDRLLVDTDELVVSWDIADFAEVHGYQLFLDGTYLGGRYDQTLYVKDLPATTGRLELRAVGPDGTVSAPATLDLDAATAPSGLDVVTDATGTMTVAWAPAAAPTDPDAATTVRIESRASTRYAAAPFVAETTVPAGTTTAGLTGLPVDGSGYVVTVRTGDGTTVAAQGTLTDATLERYPVCEAAWADDDTVTLPRPTLADWRYLRVAESWADDGATLTDRKQFAYTYGQPATDRAIRGRTVRQAYTIDLHRTDSTLWVALEDYAGNVTADDLTGWTRVPRPGEACTAQDLGPDLTDTGHSTLRASTGAQPADGTSSHTLTVEVRDPFGNPVTGQDVTFELPAGLALAGTEPVVPTGAVWPAVVPTDFVRSAADDAGTQPAGSTAVVGTGTSGTATVEVVSTAAGAFVVGASIDGRVVLNGAGTSVTFAALPVALGPTGPDPGTEPADVTGSGQTTGSTLDRLPWTGGQMAGLLALALAVLAGGGVLTWAVRHRKATDAG